MLLSISEFIGHFHPVIVHLPIGILLIGILLQWLSRRENYKGIQQAVPVVFFCGMLAAILSCITGYILSNNDDYDKTIVSWHQWMGIAVALTSSVLCLKIKYPELAVNNKILSFILLLLIFITGHLGGSLTHGSDYLTKPLADVFGKDTIPNTIIKPLPNVQEAYVYNDVVRPILQTKCYSCHGVNKQKGKLRMDDSVMLMKGGKDGKVIEPGDANRSAMIKRLLLPVDNEDHMPPKEKAQPSESQIVLLEWWISHGAVFGKKVKEINQPDKIGQLLFALQKTNVSEKKSFDIPEGSVAKADGTVVEKLKSRGVVVLPIAQNSNWLKANFFTDTTVNADDLQSLLGIKKQLIWLKMGGTNTDDSDMVVIAQLKNLMFLNLEHTSITDKGLREIQSLKNLNYLNLVGTKITSNGILQLKDLKSLQYLYLYQTNVRKADWKILQGAFPKTQIDSGGYQVPLLQTDTIVVKAKKEY
ncbi:MAG TPA: c-type cytochrome domain-containing protein [Puia sp.]|nr:c-type cytochrome domain-containing protein [Puia sp.]